MMVDLTSYRPLMRRQWAATKAAKAAKKTGGPFIDAMTAMQVADNNALSTAEQVHAGGPARWRAKAPRLFRGMPMKQDVGGRTETWRMGYLLVTILTRDPWMHRIVRVWLEQSPAPTQPPARPPVKRQSPTRSGFGLGTLAERARRAQS